MANLKALYKDSNGNETILVTDGKAVWAYKPGKDRSSVLKIKFSTEEMKESRAGTVLKKLPNPVEGS